MKVLILFLTLLCLSISAADGVVGWTDGGELAYSYAYARTWLGQKMRRDGWACKVGFTSGARREMEHSVWEKNGRKMQMMIWRIDSGKTGYSLGKISGKEKTNTK